MFTTVFQPVSLHRSLPNDYHVVKSAKGFSLRNGAGELLASGRRGIWFDEYTLIGECENIVWFSSQNGKTCLYDTLRDSFVVEPAFKPS